MRRVLLVLVLVAACSTAPGAQLGPDATKYIQTWTRGYSDTTCAAWRDEMDSHQRFVAAVDMLVALRGAAGGELPPPDALVDLFAAGITTACGDDAALAADINDVATKLYEASGQFQPGN
jgi:hypothetical protein